MEAVFKARSFLFLSVIMLVSGGAFAFFGITELPGAENKAITAVFLILLGVCLIGISIFYLMYNKGAFLKIIDGHITAAYGIKKKADIPYNDIEKVTLGCDLVVICKKNGEKVRITGLLNALSVYVFISETVFGRVPLDVGDGKEKMLTDLQKLKKKNLFFGILISLPVLLICAGIVFYMFFLKNVSEEVGEIMFWGAVGGTAIAFLLTFVIIRSFQWSSIKVQKKELEIRCLEFENTALLPGNPVSIYRDSDYTMRITVFGYPNSKNVYCTLEEFDEECNLVEKLRSPAFSRVEKLSEQFGDFKDMIKIG